MGWVNKFSLAALFALAFGRGLAVAEFYLKPGDSGELAFTVLNASDSVNILSTPQIVYSNPPTGFSVDNVSMAAYDGLKQGTSCQFTIDFSIAENAPASAENLNFKVIFSTPTVYPPVWYPAAGVKIVVDGTPPSLSVIQPKWLDYFTSTTVIPAGGMEKIIRGPAASFYASDMESGIADFQISNSSGENLSAEYFSNTSGAVAYSGQFTEDFYDVSVLNKSGLSTTGKVYIDFTPVIAVSSFTTVEVSA